MAVIIDDHVRAAIAQRRAAGRDSTLYLRVELLPSRGFPSRTLTVSWAPRYWPPRRLETREVNGQRVVMDRRAARYTLWHDLTITLWRLGPWTHLEVRDELSVLLDIEEWERIHPASAPANEILSNT
jgi:hypothetical protein